MLVASPVETTYEVADRQTEISECPKWAHVAAGKDFSLAVSDRGQVYTTGHNECGTLGLPDLPRDCANRFSKLHTASMAKVIKVFAGGDHSFLLLDPLTQKIEPAPEKNDSIIICSSSNKSQEEVKVRMHGDIENLPADFDQGNFFEENDSEEEMLLQPLPKMGRLETV